MSLQVIMLTLGIRHKVKKAMQANGVQMAVMEQPENLPMKLPYRMDLLARKRTG